MLAPAANEPPAGWLHVTVALVSLIEKVPVIALAPLFLMV